MMFNTCPMLKNIYATANMIGTHTTQVVHIHVTRGDRIRSEQVLLSISKDDRIIDIKAQQAGWIRFVAVKLEQTLTQGDLLLIMDNVDMDGYRLDQQEINPLTELGDLGRRGLERQGQDKIGPHAAALFDVPQQAEGAERSVKTHPLLKNMKEGVPPKMADARHNDQAVDRFAEEATHDPNLKPSQKLQAQLNINPGPSNAPTLTRG